VAALPAGLLGFERDRVDRLAVEVGDDRAAVRARPTSPWRVRRVVKTGFQWKPIRILTRPRTKNSWPVGWHTQLLAQLDELDQRVRAVEHPDLGARHRLLDLAPPLVNQVRVAKSTRVRR
jgi:hypothetical protein